MNPSLKYFLRYCLTWLFEFWLRPLDIRTEIQQHNLEGIALITATINGLLLGFLFGLQTGDMRMVGALAGAGTFTGVFTTGTVASAVGTTFVGAVVFTVAFAISVTFVGAFVGAYAITVTFVSAITFVVAFMIAFIGAFAVIFVEAVSENKIILFKLIDWFLAFCIVFLFLLFIRDILYPHSETIQIPILVLTFSLAIGVVSEYCNLYEIMKNKQVIWLTVFWLLFLLLAIYFNFINTDLANKIKSLIPFFIATPVIATGLPFWVFMALISLWQYQTKNIINFNESIFLKTAPFRWQTFAYPLPSLANYLFKIGQNDIKKSLLAIKLTQHKTLQNKAVATAIKKLASDPTTAFNFCTEFIEQFNINTIKQLALIGSLGSVMACLFRSQENEDEQEIELYLGEIKEPSVSQFLLQYFFLVKVFFSILAILSIMTIHVGYETTNLELSEFIAILLVKHEATNPELSKFIIILVVKAFFSILAILLIMNIHVKVDTANNELSKFISIRKKSLLERLYYAQNQLNNCQNIDGYVDILKLLQSYQRYLIKDFVSIPSLPFTLFNKNYQNSWLQNGWSALNDFIILLSFLKDYVDLSSQTARQEFLIQATVKLKNISLKNSSDYWQSIVNELIQHWLVLLENEITQAREWLKLDVKLENSDYLFGTQNLLLKVINPTTTTARNVCIQVEDGLAIKWHYQEIRLKFLETQQQPLRDRSRVVPRSDSACVFTKR